MRRITPAAGPGGGDPVLGPLGDQTPLEMGDRPEHVEDKLTGGRLGVDPFLQTEQGDATFLEHRDRGQQFAERAVEAVEADDRERVPFTGIGEQRFKAWPLHRFAGNGYC